MRYLCVRFRYRFHLFCCCHSIWLRLGIGGSDLIRLFALHLSLSKQIRRFGIIKLAASLAVICLFLSIISLSRSFVRTKMDIFAPIPHANLIRLTKWIKLERKQIMQDWNDWLNFFSVVSVHCTACRWLHVFENRTQNACI